MEFLGFIEAGSTNGEAVDPATTFTYVHEKYGIVVAMMRSQGYDGAANMAGVLRGVQARIRQQIHGAIYMHCKGHNVFLAIVHATSLW